MKIFRFMSEDEFTKFQNGDVLVNITDHREYSNTNSKGFCFLNLEDFNPEDSFHFLSGIVSADYCVIFETNKKLNETYGVYADSSNHKEILEKGLTILDWIDLWGQIIDPEKRRTVKIKEYCIDEYSNEDFKIISYAKPIYWQEWKWYNV